LPPSIGPKISSDTMFTMPAAVFCWLIARAWPRAASFTSKASSCSTLLFKPTSIGVVPPAGTVTLWVNGSSPMYSTSSETAPAGTAEIKKRPSALVKSE